MLDFTPKTPVASAVTTNSTPVINRIDGASLHLGTSRYATVSSHSSTPSHFGGTSHATGTRSRTTSDLVSDLQTAVAAAKAYAGIDPAAVLRLLAVR